MKEAIVGINSAGEVRAVFIIDEPGDERECFICRGRGKVQHCGGHMLKWYRCKHCDGYGSVKRKANPQISRDGGKEEA